jgi:hypothetical protein
MMVLFLCIVHVCAAGEIGQILVVVSHLNCIPFLRAEEEHDGIG